MFPFFPRLATWSVVSHYKCVWLYRNCTSYSPLRFRLSQPHYSHSLLYKYRNTITQLREKSETERSFSCACFSSAMRLPFMNYCVLNHFLLHLFQRLFGLQIWDEWLIHFLKYKPSYILSKFRTWFTIALWCLYSVEAAWSVFVYQSICFVLFPLGIDNEKVDFLFFSFLPRWSLTFLR